MASSGLEKPQMAAVDKRPSHHPTKVSLLDIKGARLHRIVDFDRPRMLDMEDEHVSLDCSTDTAKVHTWLKLELDPLKGARQSASDEVGLGSLAVESHSVFPGLSCNTVGHLHEFRECLPGDAFCLDFRMGSVKFLQQNIR